MKKQILTLVIGILIGAIIATGVFLVLKDDSGYRGERGERPEMQGEMPEMDENMVGEGLGGSREDMRQDNNGGNTTTDSNTSSSETMCVEENDIVEEGENILKYTNGKYLTAPYDLVVTSYSVPETETKATDSNYVEVQDMENLLVSLNIVVRKEKEEVKE